MAIFLGLVVYFLNVLIRVRSNAMKLRESSSLAKPYLSMDMQIYAFIAVVPLFVTVLTQILSSLR